MGATQRSSSAYHSRKIWRGGTSPSTPSPIIRCGTSGGTHSTATRDLEAKLIRAVGTPEQRFREDYLRILRGLRFAARFGFEIDPNTWEAMRATAEGLKYLSAERVREEWYKGLRTAVSLRRLLDLWVESGAARHLAARTPDGSPDYPNALRLAHRFSARARHAHVGRLPERAAAVPAALREESADVPRDPVLLTALLCIDPVAVLVRLKASNAEIARAAAMLTGPGEPEGNSPVGVRRWMAAVGDAADDLTRLWQLQHGAKAPVGGHHAWCPRAG